MTIAITKKLTAYIGYLLAILYFPPMKNLKNRIKNGEAVNGCWLNLGSSITAEMVGIAGFDWVLIDLEHGAGSEKDVICQLQALSGTSAAAIVRVEAGSSERIDKVLDFGAEGVMVPRLNTPQEANEIVRALRYPPKGGRGVAKMIRATGYGRNPIEYMQSADENIVGIVQVETVGVLNHLDEIAAIDGIDVLFIGPSDLSMSLGIFGQFDHPIFKDALKATVTAASKAGKATGILIFNADDYKTYYDMGIRFIACGADGTFVSEGARIMAGKLEVLRNELQNGIV
ncbi:MAG: aldolase/citrate lyase family protein [Chitinophagaceae bacterium]